MAKKDFLVSIDLLQNELLNSVQQNLAAHPSTPVIGQTYFNTALKTFFIYAPTNPNSDGAGWLDLGGSTTTNLAQGTRTNTSVEVTSSTGNSATLLEATTLLAGVLSSTKFNEIAANTLKVSNVSTQLSLGTINGTSLGITSDGGADDVVLPQANTTQAGLLSAAKWNEIVANTAKVSNVSTQLSVGTRTTTTFGITSDGSADDVILLEATTLLAGVLSATKFNEIVANTAKVGVTTASVDAAGAVMNSDTSTVAMSFVVDEDAMTSNSATKVPTQQSVKAYVDAQVGAALTSEMSFKGDYNAATNSPLLDATPIATAVGDTYVVTAAGTFFTIPVEIGDMLIAKTVNATLETQWVIVNKNLDDNSILAAVKNVDGTGSGLDADLLDGNHASAFQLALTNPVTGTGTANLITYWTGTNTIGALPVATYPSLAELAYVKGVTSAIQTQLNDKLPTASYTAADVLAKLVTVDGTLSGLDADLLDGQHASAFALAGHNHNGTYEPANAALTKKYAATIGGATSIEIANTGGTLNHGLGTSGDFAISVRYVATGAFVDCEIVTNASTGLVTFNFNTAPAAASLRVVIIG